VNRAAVGNSEQLMASARSSLATTISVHSKEGNSHSAWKPVDRWAALWAADATQGTAPRAAVHRFVRRGYT